MVAHSPHLQLYLVITTALLGIIGCLTTWPTYRENITEYYAALVARSNTTAIVIQVATFSPGCRSISNRRSVIAIQQELGYQPL